MGLPPLKIEDLSQNQSSIPALKIGVPDHWRLFKDGVKTHLIPTNDRVNIIPNPNAAGESTTPTEWVEFDDGAVSTPVDMTGGSPTGWGFALITTSTNEIGPKGFKLTRGALNNGQGEGVAIETITIPREWRGKELTLRFDYFNDSGYVDDLDAWIYDMDNTALLTLEALSHNDNRITSSSTRTQFIAKFYCPTDCTQVRFGFMGHSTTLGSANFYFGNVVIERQEPYPAPIISRKQDWTPSFSSGVTVGNGTFNDSWWIRVGNRMLGSFEFELGSTSAITGTPLLTIPNSESIDGESVIGQVQLVDTGSASYTGDISKNGSTSLRIRTEDSNSAYGYLRAPSSTVPFTWTTGDKIQCTFDIPIDGWDTGNLMSTTEANNLAVIGMFSHSTGQTIPNSTQVLVDYNSSGIDTHNAYQSGSGYNSGTGAWTTNPGFVVPRKGKYKICASAQYDSHTVGAGTNYYLGIAVNGSLNKVIAYEEVLSADASSAVIALDGVPIILDLEKDDLVTPLVRQTNGSSVALTSSATYSHFTIESIPDFKTFGAFFNSNIMEAISSTKTITSSLEGDVLAMTGNSLTLPPGRWAITGLIKLTGSNSAVDISLVTHYWGSENGDDSSSSVSGITTEAGYNSFRHDYGGQRYCDMPSNTIIVNFTTEDTVYLVPKVSVDTALGGNTINCTANLIAWRLP